MLLIFAGPVRKRSSSPVPRFLVWSCYLLADWVADLALGLMLNNMGSSSSSSSSGSTVQQQHVSGGAAVTNSSSPAIFAFWTPFLLLLLGGSDTITAYSMEDNELWLRHLIGLLFELFSASVIFFCSLKSNPLVPATVLMFLVGIVKYGERTYSLYSGSVDGFRTKILIPEPGPDYAKIMNDFDAEMKAGRHAKIIGCREDALVIESKGKGKCTLEVQKEHNLSLEAQAYTFFLMFRRLFVNLILSYKERKISRAYLLDDDDDTPAKAFEVIEVELNFIYDMVYTKAPIAHTKAGCVFRFLGTACIVSSLLIFFFHGKDGFLEVDITITYALLLGGLALDVVALLMLLCSDRMIIFLEETETPRMAWLAKAVRSLRGLWHFRRWSERISQLNLISNCLGKADSGGFLRRCIGTPWVKEMIFDDFFLRRERLCCRKLPGQEETALLKFMFNGLQKRAMDAMDDAKSTDMSRICGRRGDGILEHLDGKIRDMLKLVYQEADVAEEKLDLLKGSVAVDKEFDESLLLWHIATDLCLVPRRENNTIPTTVTENKMRAISKTLSEYMLYLLIKQPEMLSATAGIGLIRYQDTRAEAQRFFKSADPDNGNARWMLLAVNTSKEPSKVKGDQSKSVLFDGVILAKTLRELDEELMWEVVAGVWGEMLTYAAGKCRGSTHVKQLSCGSELITMVWFLMVHMGLGDMYKIHEGNIGSGVMETFGPYQDARFVRPHNS